MRMRPPLLTASPSGLAVGSGTKPCAYTDAPTSAALFGIGSGKVADGVPDTVTATAGAISRLQPVMPTVPRSKGSVKWPQALFEKPIAMLARPCGRFPMRSENAAPSVGRTALPALRAGVPDAPAQPAPKGANPAA